MVETETPRTSGTMDTSDPLYVHPGDSPGQPLVSTCFNGNGFSSWKRSMLIALSAKNKIGFINGDVIKPSETDSKIRLWERCNDMVISWILNSVHKDIAECIMYDETAKEMWEELLERFEQFNGAKLYQVQHQLSQLSQGSDSISGYFTSLKKLWEELRSILVMPSCKCGASQAMSKHEEDQKVVKFLMGLNESYNTVRGNILMMKPMPGINAVYSLLIQEEKQREITLHSPLNLDASAMAARNWGNQQNYNRPSSQQNGNYMNASKPNTGRNPQTYNGRKNNYFCTHCKMDGHSNSRCHKLHPELRRNGNMAATVTTQANVNARADNQHSNKTGRSDNNANLADFPPPKSIIE